MLLLSIICNIAVFLVEKHEDCFQKFVVRFDKKDIEMLSKNFNTTFLAKL